MFRCAILLVYGLHIIPSVCCTMEAPNRINENKQNVGKETSDCFKRKRDEDERKEEFDHFVVFVLNVCAYARSMRKC